MNPRVPFVWKRPHHFYHGVAIASYSVIMWYVSVDNWMEVGIPFWQLCIGIGIFMALDDIVEHTVTGSTPLRLLFDKIIYPILSKYYYKD